MAEPPKPDSPDTREQIPGQTAGLIQEWQIPPGGLRQRHHVASDTIANGDLYYGDGNNKFIRLPIGTEEKILQVINGVPSWQTQAASAAGGWNALGATLTYSSADGHTFVASTSADITASVPVGARIKLTQTTAKYFIVTAIDATTITLYGGTDYTLTSATITNPYYSLQKAPVGFPIDPTKWTETTSDTSSRSQATPTGGTWYNLGSLKLDVPIGYWHISYSAFTRPTASSQTYIFQYITLSTANNTESDTTMTGIVGFEGVAAGNLVADAIMQKTKDAIYAAKTSLYLNACVSSGNAAATITFRGDAIPTIIKAICAYL